MQLIITKLATAIMLTWSTPQAGTCYLMSTTDHLHYKVEMSFRYAYPVHAAFKVDTSKTNQFFSLQFKPDNN